MLACSAWPTHHLNAARFSSSVAGRNLTAPHLALAIPGCASDPNPTCRLVVLMVKIGLRSRFSMTMPPRPATWPQCVRCCRV